MRKILALLGIVFLSGSLSAQTTITPPERSLVLMHITVTTPEERRQLVRAYKELGADFIKPYNLLSREVYLAIIDEAGRLKIPVEGHVPFSMTAMEVSDLGQITIEHNFDVLASASRDEHEIRKALRSVLVSVWCL